MNVNREARFCLLSDDHFRPTPFFPFRLHWNALRRKQFGVAVGRAANHGGLHL